MDIYVRGDNKQDEKERTKDEANNVGKSHDQVCRVRCPAAMLEIEFANNGQIWQFDNVPEDIWYRFRSHHLPELFFHNFIMGHYPERRMQEMG